MQRQVTQGCCTLAANSLPTRKSNAISLAALSNFKPRVSQPEEREILSLTVCHPAVQPRHKFKKKKSIIIAVHKKSTITTLPERRERITTTVAPSGKQCTDELRAWRKMRKLPKPECKGGKGENGQTLTQGLVKIRQNLLKLPFRLIHCGTSQVDPQSLSPKGFGTSALRIVWVESPNFKPEKCWTHWRSHRNS